ncbi:MAG: GNAT family acetyltransferase, partial [Planctomycetaceae bacterium]
LPDSAPHNDPATSLRNKRAVEADLLFVAVDDDNGVVGTVMGGYDGHRGWVYSLAVLPSHRRRGIGTALVSALEERLVGRGCLKVNLQVRTSNAAVVAFYKQLGYDVEDRLSLGKRLYV